MTEWTKDDLLISVSDAIDDSIDADWRPDDGAKYVVAMLEREYPAMLAAPTMAEALEKARHTLVAAHNYRVTDLDVETFEALLNNGVPRDRLEFMTDYSAEIAGIDAALALAKGEDRHD
jgi:hypothetical protein